MATIIKRGEKYLVQIRRKGLPTTCRSFHAKADAEQWARHMEIKADIPHNHLEVVGQTLLLTPARDQQDGKAAL